MNTQYLLFSEERLAEDPEFVSWVLNGTHNDEWNNFLTNHHDFKNKAERAKEIILLKSKDYKLDDCEVLTMWQNILHYRTLLSHKGVINKEKDNTFYLKRIFRFAAVLLILVSIGVSVIWYLTSPSQRFGFVLGDPIIKEEAKLILQNGEEVILKKDFSSVELQKEGKIMINKEESIALKVQQQYADKDVKMNKLIIPYGKRSFLVLNDNTKIWLCAGSRLAFPSEFIGKKREVYLEGEAYFDVAPDSDKPFIVNTKKMSLKVLGTRFYLSACSSDKEIVTVLVDGKITLHDNSLFGITMKEIVLEPGQKALFNKSNNQINVSQENDFEFYIAWTKGWFLFSKANIITIFNKLERYYNVKFFYDDSYNLDDLISGKLDLKDSISNVMVILSDLVKFSFKIDNDNIYIEKN